MADNSYVNDFVPFRPDLLPPPSVARTSWDLFEDVIAAMRAEPARVNMQMVLGDVPRGACQPRCGTQGCIRGWLQVVTRETEPGAIYDLKTRAAKNQLDLKLPLTAVDEDGVPFEDDIDDLFYGVVSDRYPWPLIDSNTPDYAEAVIVNIRKFMAKWETALKGHVIQS